MGVLGYKYGTHDRDINALFGEYHAPLGAKDFCCIFRIKSRHIKTTIGSYFNPHYQTIKLSLFFQWQPKFNYLAVYFFISSCSRYAINIYRRTFSSHIQSGVCRWTFHSQQQSGVCRQTFHSHPPISCLSLDVSQPYNNQLFVAGRFIAIPTISCLLLDVSQPSNNQLCADGRLATIQQSTVLHKCVIKNNTNIARLCGDKNINSQRVS